MSIPKITVSDVVNLYTDPNNPDCLLNEEQHRDQQRIAEQITAEKVAKPPLTVDEFVKSWRKASYKQLEVQVPAAAGWLIAMRKILYEGKKQGLTHISLPADYATWLLNNYRLPIPEYEPTPGKPIEPLDQIDQMLACVPYPQPKAMCVQRFEDMSANGLLTLIRQDDGDVIVHVATGSEAEDFMTASVEFCTPMIGGGQSSHTHRALVALMVAMEKDEEERKQSR